MGLKRKLSEGLRLLPISFLATVLGGQGIASGQDQDEEVMQRLRRKTPSGNYIDPASFFRLHGYTTLTFVDAGAGLGAELGATPQILVPALSGRTDKNAGGFKNDSALFVGGEPFNGVASTLEIHFVGDAIDPVITEAKMVWEMVGKDGAPFTLRLVGGRYWWPFGIHDNEWFSAVNQFSVLSPAAAEVLPPHYNEVGLMGEGEIRLGRRIGLNYLVSAGNGMSGFDLEDNVKGSGQDSNSNRTLTGRLGLGYFYEPLDFILGFSVTNGTLREVGDATLPPGSPQRFAADMSAWGPDLELHLENFKLIAYYYQSTEKLQGAALSQLKRNGYTVEPSYTFRRDGDMFSALSLVGRLGKGDEESLDGATYRRTQVGFGVKVDMAKIAHMRLGYVVQKEGRDLPEIENNLFSFSMTTDF